LDYQRLAAYHYRGGRPVGVTRVFVARHACETVGVLVETRPVLNCLLRGAALGGRYDGGDREVLAVLLNREVRTLARVIVEPRFRGIGLGVALVRHALAHAQTRYVEALAVMGQVQPFFEKAGMRGFERPMGVQAVRLLAAIEADAGKDQRRKTKDERGTGMELLLALREEMCPNFSPGNCAALPGAKPAV